MARTEAALAVQRLLADGEPPTALEEHELLVRVRAGDAAAEDELVRRNVRLVADLAHRYHSNGATFEDFFQEGVLGLLRAARKFDTTRGFRFSTYATHWIRQALTRFGMGPTRVIRLPEMVRVRIARLIRELEALSTVRGAPARPEELAKVLGEEPEEVERLLRLSQDASSLDASIQGEGDLALGGGVADLDGPSTEEVAIARVEGMQLRDALARMPGELQTILSLRFGLEDEAPLSFARIGKRLGCSRERIRQRTREGLRMLRWALETPPAPLDASPTAPILSPEGRDRFHEELPRSRTSRLDGAHRSPHAGAAGPRDRSRPPGRAADAGLRGRGDVPTRPLSNARSLRHPARERAPGGLRAPGSCCVDPARPAG